MKFASQISYIIYKQTKAWPTDQHTTNGVTPKYRLSNVVCVGVGTGSSEPDRTGSLIWRVPESFTFQTNDSLNDSNVNFNALKLC